MNIDVLSGDALNEQIAVFMGWKRKDGEWFDPTGDKFDNPPNYTDNSGLFIGLAYKMRARGYDVTIVLPAQTGADMIVSLSNAEQTFLGNGASLALAGCRAVCKAIQAVI